MDLFGIQTYLLLSFVGLFDAEEVGEALVSLVGTVPKAGDGAVKDFLLLVLVVKLEVG